MSVHTKFEMERPLDEKPGLVVMLETLWRYKGIIAMSAGVCSALALLALVFMPSTYRSTATIELSFNREEAAQSAQKGHTKLVAPMEPGALINGAAQSIASRANASRVVSALQLDTDPAYGRQTRIGALMAATAKSLGLTRQTPTPHERAVDQAVRDLKVEIKPHLYVIGVAYTSTNPERAANMANAFALEHLRSERLKELRDAWSVAARELVMLSESIGERHPRHIETRARAEHLQMQIDTLRDAEPSADKFMLAGQTLTLAEPITTPIGPKRLLILAAALAFGLGLGVMAALAIDRLPAPLRERLLSRPRGRLPQGRGGGHPSRSFGRPWAPREVHGQQRD